MSDWQLDRAALDRHITGNYGEDQLDRSDHETDGSGGTFEYVVNVVDPDEPGLVLCSQCWDRHWRKARDEAAPIPNRDDEIGIDYSTRYWRGVACGFAAGCGFTLWAVVMFVVIVQRAW